MNLLQNSRLLLSRHSRLSTCVHHVRGTRTGPQPPTGSLARQMSSTRRRKRKKYEKYTSIKSGADLPGQSSGLETPFQYSGENLDEYTELATLSPWTPVPDSVARKIFDRADVQQDDVRRNKRLSFVVVKYILKISLGSCGAWFRRWKSQLFFC